MLRSNLNIFTLLSLLFITSSVQANDVLRYIFLPNEVLVNAFKADEKLYLAGFVSDIKREENGVSAELNVTDSHANITVKYDGILPDLMTEGVAGMFTGYLNAEVFVTNEIVVISPETCADYVHPTLQAELVSLGFHECSPAGS
jgi:cytochrome c-type biogenesis protein CcmE